MISDTLFLFSCVTSEIEEIAALAAFAASTESSFTTGFTFDATGGRATY